MRVPLSIWQQRWIALKQIFIDKPALTNGCLSCVCVRDSQTGWLSFPLTTA